MRWTPRLCWLLFVSLTAASQAAAQITSPPQPPTTSEIEALRARLRVLDDERARIAQHIAELERRASTPGVAAPAVPTPPNEEAVSPGGVAYLETVVVTGTRRD